MERLLRVLAEGLLSLSEEKCTLAQDQVIGWYEAINKLYGAYNRIVRGAVAGLENERWSVHFLLLHCQSLLLRIKGSDTKTERAVEKGWKVVDAALHLYSQQYVDGKNTLIGLLQAQRSRANWHIDFLALEKQSFDAIFSGTISNVRVSEIETVVELRDRIGKELIKPRREISLKVKKIVGAFTDTVHGMGPYEETHDTITLGFLDILYQLCFHLSTAAELPQEIAGAVYPVLQRSSSSHLHHQAIQVYWAIRFCGEKGMMSYEDLEDEASIESWLEKSTESYRSREAAME